MPPTPLPTDLRLFEWLDHNSWAHWLLAWSAFGLFLAAALAPFAPAGSGAPRPRWLRVLGSNTVFVGAVLLVFCAFRWPLWFAGPMENPDEAQWIAGALTLRDGGLPWKHLDCHTSGPLNAALLLLTLPLGLPLDYLGVRVLTMLLQAAAALGLWGAARRYGPEWTARLALLPVVNLWACRWHHDISQYSSEHASVLLLSLAGWVGAVALTTDRPRLRPALLGVAGALTTTPLFAKLQSLPLVAALGLLLLGAIWFAPTPAATDTRDRLRRSAVLAAGALVPIVAFLGYVGIYGLGRQVRLFYWTSNLLYAEARHYPFVESPDALQAMAKPLPGGAMIILGTVAFALLVFIPGCLAEPSRRGRLAGAWVLFVAALGAILGPGRIFLHYLHFLALPLGWLAATGLAAAHNAWCVGQPPSLRLRMGLVAGFLLVSSAWPIWETTHLYRPMNGQLFFWRERQSSSVGVLLRALSAPGDKLVVWGWSPGYHVESGLGQGARDAHSERLINAGPLQAAYRDRLLFDLRRNQPRWFVDAVAPGHFGYRDRDLQGHETWPELREFIATNYALVDELGGVRLYRRRV